MLPEAAAGQTIESPFRFIQGRHDAGVVVGTAAEDRGPLGIGPGGGTLIGARYALDIRGPFAFEGNGFYLSTNRDVYQPVLDEGLVRLGRAEMALVGADARIRFTLTGDRTWYRLAPYVSVGGGIVGQFGGQNVEAEAGLPQEDQFDFGPSFLGVLAAGTRWLPTDRFTVRAETSLTFWKLGMPPGFQEVGAELGARAGDHWAGVGSVLVGVSYRF